MSESDDEKELEFNSSSQHDMPSATSSSDRTASTLIELQQVSRSNQYNIAWDRPRREIRPPQIYGETDFVAYALSIAEKTDASGKPLTYLETLFSYKL